MSSRTWTAITSLVLFLLALAVNQPVATAHVTAVPSAEQVLGWLNQQRTTNGLPPLTLDAAMSAGCAAHINYMAINHVIQHTEDPSKPGYTAAGAYAGTHAVLDEGAYWVAPSPGDPSFGDPFEVAPFHLSGILTPWLGAVGIDQHAGFLCIANAGPGNTPPGQLYVYPGDGTRGWSPREVSNEIPATPESVLKINPVVGKHLYVWVSGSSTPRPSLRVQTATLIDNSGNDVPLRWCTNANCGWLVAYDAAIFIPTEPLKAKATYHASVTVSTPFGVLSRNWSFTTSGTSSGSSSSSDSGSTPPAPTGPGCDAPNGSLSVGIGVAGRAAITLQCHPANLRLRLTVSRFGANGQVVHRYPTVSAQASRGVLSVSYRHLFAGKVRVGRYQLLLEPANGRALFSRFGINR